MKSIKERLRKGETLIGCWSNLGSSVATEIVGLAGYDWVLIDLEHGAGGEGDVIHQLQALEHTSAAPVIRVEGSQRQRISRVLDMGAEGIMCPRVNNSEEAEAVVRALTYPPAGSRGVAKIVRATGFGSDFKRYFDSAPEVLLGIVQIETVEALRNLDAIAAVDGVDVLFIGPADLTMELGIFGQFDDPAFRDAVKAVTRAAEKSGKSSGILLGDPDDFDRYHDQGIRLIACGSDASFVAKGARDVAGALQSARSATNKAIS